MLKLAVVVFVVLWSGSAEAIIWEFDDGTTQGWVAKGTLTLGGPREFDVFPGVVEDGVCGRLMSRPLLLGIGLGRMSN